MKFDEQALALIHSRGHRVFNDLYRFMKGPLNASMKRDGEADLSALVWGTAMFLHATLAMMKGKMDAQGDFSDREKFMHATTLIKMSHDCGVEMDAAILQGVDPTAGEEGFIPEALFAEFVALLQPTPEQQKKAEELVAEALRKATIGLKGE